jgi:3D (Asp-Asp-Asp) domain-containing protein
LPVPVELLFQAAVLQMLKSLNLTIAIAVICVLVGCAEQPVTTSAVKAQIRPVAIASLHPNHMQNVRTTAYTRSEKGGQRNALGAYLSGRHVISAAADWSRFPLGTRFRIVNTREEFIIDDYGTALVGTNTIDLYRPTKLEMKRWGVRNVDIDILQWGSESASLKVLAPRCKHPQVKQMIAALQKKNSPASAPATDSSAAPAQASSRKASIRTID